MFKVILCALFLTLANSFTLKSQHKTSNLIIITLDGFRWNEVFMGPDPDIFNSNRTTKGKSFPVMFWDEDPLIRRKLLMPFLWTEIASKGSLYGNRNFDCQVKVANRYWFSYPGYHEILTGNPHASINSNSLGPNPDVTILEKINQLPGFKNSVALFGSWKVFPDIINKERSGIFVNSGFNSVPETIATPKQLETEKLYDLVPRIFGGVRYDGFTFVQAFEYLKNQRPRVLMIAFGETDEFGHKGDYAQYLHSAHRVDRLIAELWSWVQNDSAYRNRTSLIITTDHGRGSGNGWKRHGLLTPHSNETWIALIGPEIESLGEVRKPALHYNAQIASTISLLLGVPYEGNDPRFVQMIDLMPKPIDLVQKAP